MPALKYQRPSGPAIKRVKPVVVIEPAESGQEDLLLVRRVVSVRVGVDHQVRRRRYDDAAANHRQPQRRAQIFVLNEGLGTVRAAIAIAIRQDDDPIAGRMRQRLGLRGVEAR